MNSKSPKIIKEYYQIQSVHTDFNKERIKSSSVEFPWEMQILENDIILIQIDTTNEVLSDNDDIISKLVFRYIFTLEYISDNQESYLIIEQVLYKAYDSMFKAYKYQYKDTVLIDYDPCLPTDLSLVITDILTAIP